MSRNVLQPHRTHRQNSKNVVNFLLQLQKNSVNVTDKTVHNTRLINLQCLYFVLSCYDLSSPMHTNALTSGCIMEVVQIYVYLCNPLSRKRGRATKHAKAIFMTTVMILTPSLLLCMQRRKQTSDSFRLAFIYTNKGWKCAMLHSKNIGKTSSGANQSTETVKSSTLYRRHLHRCFTILRNKC